jgi:hypothetical protein
MKALLAFALLVLLAAPALAEGPCVAGSGPQVKLGGQDLAAMKCHQLTMLETMASIIDQLTAQVADLKLQLSAAQAKPQPEPKP